MAILLKEIPKNVKVHTVKKPAGASKGDAVILDVEADCVLKYNEACDAEKKAKETKDLYGPQLRMVGSEEAFALNCAARSFAASSLVIRDDTGAQVRMDFTKQYGAPEVAKVNALFSAIRMNANDYVVETLLAKFDSSVFLGADGLFNKPKYDRYLAAIEAVAAEVGDACPLQCQKAVAVKEDFYERRWKDFAVGFQADVSQALPNTVRLTPKRDKADK